MSSVEMALQGVVLERAIDRSQLLVRDAEQRFSAGMERVALGKRARVSGGGHWSFVPF